jgi:hypothetical protein
MKLTGYETRYIPVRIIITFVFMGRLKSLFKKKKPAFCEILQKAKRHNPGMQLLN